MPKQTAFSLSLPKTHGQLKLWNELYTRSTPQDICNYTSVLYVVKGIKNHLQNLKILHIGTLKQLPCSIIHSIIHEPLHQTDVKVIFDLDENPEKGHNKL